MRPPPRAWLAVGLVTVLLAGAWPTAGEATPSGPGPDLPLQGDDPVVAALLDRQIHQFEQQPCHWTPDTDDRCTMGAAAWWSNAVAAVGIDPSAWPGGPAPAGNLRDWMLAHPDEYEHASLAGPAVALALSIVGLVAAEVDPKRVPLPTGGHRNLVQELADRANAGGHYGIPRDNIWPLFAFNAARHLAHPVPTTVLALEALQHPEGWWSWNSFPPADVDMTSWAVMALAPHDRDAAVARALDFLDRVQVTSGEYRGCWPANPGGTPSADSTAAALQALASARQDPQSWRRDGQSPIECLLGFRRDDGSFRRAATGGGHAISYQILPALAWQPYGYVRGPTHPPERTLSTPHDTEIPIEIPGGFLRWDGERHDALLFRADVRGFHTFHGVQWDADGRPLPARVRVEVPDLPAAPTVTAPPLHPHRLPFLVIITTLDPWAEAVALALPGGDPHGGTHHEVRLEGPGLHTLQAWAVNRYGEAGEARFVHVEATNAPPSLTVLGPDHAPRTGPVTLRADTADPEGDDIAVTWHVDETPVGEGPELRLAPGAPGWVQVTVAARDAHGGQNLTIHAVEWLDAPPVIARVWPSSAPPGRVTLHASAHDPDQDPVTIQWLRGDIHVGEGSRLDMELDEGQHVVTVRGVTEYATTTTHHTLQVQRGALAVEARWEDGTLVLDAHAERLRADDEEGPPPLSLTGQEPGLTLRVASLSGSHVVAETMLTIPERPAPPPPNRPPRITVHEPAFGATVAGAFPLRGVVTDPEGDRVDLTLILDDGAVNIPVDAAGTWSLHLNATAWTPGNHTLRLRATDVNGAATGATHRVVVPEPPPTTHVDTAPEEPVPGPARSPTLAARPGPAQADGPDDDRHGAPADAGGTASGPASLAAFLAIGLAGARARPPPANLPDSAEPTGPLGPARQPHPQGTRRRLTPPQPATCTAGPCRSRPAPCAGPSVGPSSPSPPPWPATRGTTGSWGAPSAPRSSGWRSRRRSPAPRAPRPSRRNTRRTRRR